MKNTILAVFAVMAVVVVALVINFIPQPGRTIENKKTLSIE